MASRSAMYRKLAPPFAVDTILVLLIAVGWWRTRGWETWKIVQVQWRQICRDIVEEERRLNR
jgi:hypothetical protein